MVLLILLPLRGTQDFMACIYGVGKAASAGELRQMSELAVRVLVA